MRKDRYTDSCLNKPRKNIIKCWSGNRQYKIPTSNFVPRKTAKGSSIKQIQHINVTNASSKSAKSANYLNTMDLVMPTSSVTSGTGNDVLSARCSLKELRAVTT
jgi:hypothetical protein